MPISDLKGQILTSIVNQHSECLIFTTSSGKKYQMYHRQDCCESVRIEDINGHLDDLIGYPILVAEESTNRDNPKNLYDWLWGTIMNNRQIKFRAWSHKFKKFMSEGFHIIGETTLFDLLNQHRIEELDTLEIQQFTGLQDSTGADIYEGDIVEESWLESGIGVGVPPPKKKRNKYLIEWISQGFNISVGWPKVPSVHCSKHKIKIIGNIFENPNLLK